MDLILLAVGRVGDGPEAALVEHNLRRLRWKVEVREVEARGVRDAAARRRREGEALLAAIPPGARCVVLDPRGQALSSEAFAARLTAFREQAPPALVFVIGGADGLSPEVVGRADLKLSLGPMIWPHLLARAMLAEQLFRAECIQTGHPYHKA